MSPVDTGSIQYTAPLTRAQAESLPAFCCWAGVLAFVIPLSLRLTRSWRQE